MKIVMIVLCFVFVLQLSATIINVPADQSTIQAGIDASVDADTVLVQPGTYFENINYNEKNITVASLFLTTQDTTFISLTTIDGNLNGSVVTFESGEDSSALLVGFTVTNGQGEEYPESFGGGITCKSNSNPTLAYLIIQDNSGNEGGGIHCYESSPTLFSILIANNDGPGLYCTSNSSPLLSIVTISNNSAAYGGGICCSYSSSPILNNVIISDNYATTWGGGLYFHNYCNPSLNDVSVINNISDWYGGGIFCRESSIVSLENVLISGNTADNDGGGISCSFGSNLICDNVIISNNSVNNSGGGIAFNNSSPSLSNVIISNNSALEHGGGISFTHNSHPILENVSIFENSTSGFGGGVYCGNNSYPLFNNNSSSIYSNHVDSNRGSGLDIYSEDCNIFEVILDTFTVLAPTDYYASPIDNISFNIQNSILGDLINSDLYVSVNGNNSNSGINANEPLKTIQCALSKIYSDSLNINTIYLDSGIYSNTTNGEIFPLMWSSYVNLIGSEQEVCILDGNGISGVMQFVSVNEVFIENLSIINGYNELGGGIYCYDSSPNLTNLTVSNNCAKRGGGIYCYTSFPNIVNVTISNNTVDWPNYNYESGGGICCDENSSPKFENVIIDNNTAIGDHARGGGICFWSSTTLNFENITISNNISAADGGGIYYSDDNSLILTNTLISNNSAVRGGGIFSSTYISSFINLTINDNTAVQGCGIYYYGNLSSNLINCILWNDLPNEIYFYEYVSSDTITVSYSDIQDGEDGIVINDDGTINWLAGNIDEEPLFLGTGEHPYSLLDDSPCVNAGIPDTTGLILPEFDLAGNSRIFGGRIDIGAYENQNVIVNTDDCFILNKIEIFQNHPNPFNPTTSISFSIPDESNVDLSIYNIKGQKVKTVANNQYEKGDHSVVWNGDNESGESVSSGVYFYKIMVNGKNEAMKKCLLLK